MDQRHAVDAVAHAVSVLSRRLQLPSEKVRKSGSISFMLHA